jgi:hypothetical protein
MAKITILTAISDTGKKAIKDIPTTEAGIIAEEVQIFVKCGFNKIILDIGYGIKCAWCSCVIGVSEIEHSHGICETCAARTIADYQKNKNQII